jgi:hypothetical protein
MSAIYCHIQGCQRPSHGRHDLNGRPLCDTCGWALSDYRLKDDGQGRHPIDTLIRTYNEHFTRKGRDDDQKFV